MLPNFRICNKCELDVVGDDEACPRCGADLPSTSRSDTNPNCVVCGSPKVATVLMPDGETAEITVTEDFHCPGMIINVFCPRCLIVYSAKHLMGSGVN